MSIWIGIGIGISISKIFSSVLGIKSSYWKKWYQFRTTYPKGKGDICLYNSRWILLV